MVSIQENSYFLAAPLGLEPRKPASETGVLPIRLKGNIKFKTRFSGRQVKRLFQNKLLFESYMAGGERIELPPTESKSVELTVIRTPNITRHCSIALPIVRFVKFLTDKMGLEPITHRCVIAVCAFIYLVISEWNCFRILIR